MGSNVGSPDDGTRWEDINDMPKFKNFVRLAISELFDQNAYEGAYQSTQYAAVAHGVGETVPIAWYATHNRIIGGMLLRQWRYSAGACTASNNGVRFKEFVPACMHGETTYNGDESGMTVKYGFAVYFTIIMTPCNSVIPDSSPSYLIHRRCTSLL